MPAVDPDAPWWVNTLVILVALALTSGSGVWVALRGTKKRLDETKVNVARANQRLAQTSLDVAAVKDEVKNTHTTNLRHDVDKVNASATAAQASASAAQASAERTEGFVRDVDASVRALRHSLDRHVELLAARVADLEDTVPTNIARALARHVTEHHDTDKENSP